ncbi:threonine/serine exporter family protein [Geodermatophilus sp. YIM 151500]|uniref:threonine/serine ThrE exporter family protein n=1 Tax=Geodermatophilus sp. YIM 151500 TaxID=2984531 RepID=UPI0021E4343E|nr:threonine/serine exporter family protein [Geodermatophilus sp. YIM 151500]MCV2489829.1 threonine/serine exporter family protein [Geodermatophilus sp. YIM 151500]
MPTWPRNRRRSQARIPERAWRAIAGSDPPTAPISLRAQPSRMDDLTAHAALGLALRIGESMLAVGAPAADVTATVLRVAAAYGLTSCQADITFTSITVSYDRENAVPLTAMRIVRTSRIDYTRLQGITDLARAVGAGELDVEDAHRRLDRVVAAPPTYRHTVHALAWAGLAGSVGLLLGGGWLEALFAALTTALIAQVMRVLGRQSLPMFFQQAAGAALATGVAVLLLVLDVDVRTSLVVAAGIVVLLAGLSLVSAAQDAISGFPVTAGGRAFEVVTLTAGIVVGIAGVLDLAQRAQLPLTIVDPSPTPVPFPVTLAAAAGIAGCWALACHARPRAVGLAAMAGALSWTAFWAAGALGAGPALASGVAAAALGFCGEVLTERFRVPAQLVAVCGIVPLLPGLAIYRGLFAIVVDADIEGGLAALVGAGAVGLALAAGVTLGEYLGRPISRARDRYDERVRRRAMTTD